MAKTSIVVRSYVPGEGQGKALYRIDVPDAFFDKLGAAVANHLKEQSTPPSQPRLTEKRRI